MTVSGRNSMLGWLVLVDHPAQSAPRRVSRHATEAAARAEARRLNGLVGDRNRPLYFVERWETSDVLDVERSGA
jgi:hypothetical protein